MVFEHITHSDISCETKDVWKESDGRRNYYLKNGFKTSVSTVLIPLGVMGVWDSFTHNPVFTQIFGTNGFLISVLAIVAGILNIWICDRIYEHYLLKKEEKQLHEKEEVDRQLSTQEQEIKELSQQLAEEEAKIIVDEEILRLLEQKLNNLESEHQHQKHTLEKEYQQVVDRFLKDLNK